jgi:Divergent InlB B-repeat domain
MLSLLRPRLTLAALVAALTALALVLPGSAAAATERSLEVEFKGNGEGDVGCWVEGGPLEECLDEYPEGTEVTILAEEVYGSEFVEWGGDCSAFVGDECELTMDADKSVEVTFALEEFEVAIEAEGPGEGYVECQVDGGPYELCPEEETYPYETELTLFAEEEPGSEFAEWEGDCSGVEAECTLGVEEDLSVTAVFAFETPFELAIEAGGAGTGDFECEVNGGEPEECEEEYEAGDEVNVIAEPAFGSEFAEWNGDCDFAAGNECEVEMTGPKAVEAVFDLIPRSLTVGGSGSGSGSVACKVEAGPEEACESSYPNGTSITLVATADSGSTFAGFSGSGSASSCFISPCTFTIEADSAVTATFNVEESEEGEEESGGGGSSGGSTPPPPPPIVAPPPAAGTAVAAAIAPVQGNKALLKLTCKGGGACRGALKLYAKLPSSGGKKGKRHRKKSKLVLIGKASFSIAAGGRRTIKAKIKNGQAKKLLRKGKVVKAKLKGSDVANRTIKLKPAKSKHKKHKKSKKRH